ncbi:MAG: gamma-glutamyltransferase [Candidatus Competibacterales bacterium]
MDEQWEIHKAARLARGGMVATQHVAAATAGAEALAAGGNAVDAAVVTALVASVVEPWMCGLGGNGYLLYCSADGQTVEVINFQGVVPAHIDLRAYPQVAGPPSLMGFPPVAGRHNEVGYGAISVPGACAGLSMALERLGRFGFDRALTWAIDHARRGLVVDWHTTLQIALAFDDLAKDPGAAAQYLPQGHPPEPETRLENRALVATLETLADRGPEAFYRGKVAQQLVEDLAAGGSAIDGDDLAAYGPQVTTPLTGTYRGIGLWGGDATSGAQRLLEALAHCEDHFTPGQAPDAEAYTAYALGLQRAFIRHKQRMGAVGSLGCTSHISAVDGAGNMVALTFTLLNRFGSRVVLPRTGLVMNNALGYFDPRPGLPASLMGNKRINASNMCPTIAVAQGRPWFALGASGANTIVPAVTQLAALLVDFGLDLEAAFHVPRLQVSDGEALVADARLPIEVMDALARHFTVSRAQAAVFPKPFACPSGVWRDPVTGLWGGMADPTLPTGGARGVEEMAPRGVGR